LNAGDVMAVSFGKNFRRLLAQALAADEGEMRALIERVLPRAKDGKRVLRPENDNDCQLLPLAIVAALSADAITGDEAEELKRQAKDAKPTNRLFWDDYPRELVLLNPLERIRLGYPPPPGPSYPSWHDDAAKNGTAIVNNNENTIAENNDAPVREKPNPL
jgi:hypothetical protein